MNRRRFLATGTAAFAGLSGCLGVFGGGGDGPPGPKNGDDLPSDDDPNDGLPPQFENPPEPKSVDTSSFETIPRNGVDVPLAPVDVTYNWYARREARFADARGPTSFQRARIYGAVSSPAQSRLEGTAVSEWPKDERVVCYCGCPHHLSSIRASTLIKAGFTDVYVIDEGFGEWYGRNYPIIGSQVESRPATKLIRGETSPAFAGQMAWARHLPTEQMEAVPIANDGSYALELKFYDVTDASIISLETPEYELEAPLGDLTSTLVSGP